MRQHTPANARERNVTERDEQARAQTCLEVGDVDARRDVLRDCLRPKPLLARGVGQRLAELVRQRADIGCLEVRVNLRF